VYLRQVHSLREVLPQQAVSIFIGTTLPWMLWITVVHLDVGCQAEALVIRHFLAPIPGQGLVKLLRQPVRLLDQRVDHGQTRNE
jgi:hypothetical protein